MTRAVDKDDGCFECIHTPVRWNRGMSFCDHFESIVYISEKTGVYKRVRPARDGEGESHVCVGTCVKFISKLGDEDEDE